ncbi:hypothetical protein SeLEV6574_g05569 [Synchytrium endobioticum]|nr:hypothetical protein SeLEV6574_g05569 [Synchytrium endobioticum]
MRIVNDGGVAIFSGNLDVKALGGAGFASQRSTLLPPGQFYDVSGYNAIAIHILRGDGREYAFNIKNIEGERTPDGRVNSSIEYKTTFQTVKDQEGLYITKFRDFKPYYRGRPAEDAKPLDTSKITSFSIMCQSFFGKQEGYFELSILAISAVTDAWLRDNAPGGPRGV